MSPESCEKFPIPGPIDLSATNKVGNIPQPLPSVLSTARHIRDLNEVQYPEGIRSPKVELNANAQEGKFRYDREFLLQFMTLCKEKPDDLPSPVPGGGPPLVASASMSPRIGHPPHQSHHPQHSHPHHPPPPPPPNSSVPSMQPMPYYYYQYQVPPGGISNEFMPQDAQWHYSQPTHLHHAPSGAPQMPQQSALKPTRTDPQQQTATFSRPRKTSRQPSNGVDVWTSVVQPHSSSALSFGSVGENGGNTTLSPQPPISIQTPAASSMPVKEAVRIKSFGSLEAIHPTNGGSNTAPLPTAAAAPPARSVSTTASSSSSLSSPSASTLASHVSMTAAPNKPTKVDISSFFRGSAPNFNAIRTKSGAPSSASVLSTPEQDKNRRAAVRLETEEQQKNRLAEEEKARKAKEAEEAAAAAVAAAAAKKLAGEKRKAEEEQARQKAEIEAARRKAEEEEREKQRKEEERIRREEEEKQEAERRRKEEERLREEERRWQDEERLRMEEERLRKKEEEQRLREERERRERECISLEEERRKNKEEEEREQENERLCLEEEERQRLKEEEEEEQQARLAEEEEKKRLEIKSKREEQAASISEVPLSTSSESHRKRPIPGPIDLSATNKAGNMPQPLPSALSTARHIRDLNEIQYPEGIRSPKVELNANAQEGRFRYDREFLLQFMTLCKEKPDNLPSLDTIGLIAVEQALPIGGRSSSGRRGMPSSMAPTSATRQASTSLGILNKYGKSASNVAMGAFAVPSKIPTDERAMRLMSMSGHQGIMPMVRSSGQGGTSGTSGTGGKRTRSKRNKAHNEINRLGGSTGADQTPFGATSVSGGSSAVAAEQLGAIVSLEVSVNQRVPTGASANMRPGVLEPGSPDTTGDARDLGKVEEKELGNDARVRHLY